LEIGRIHSPRETVRQGATVGGFGGEWSRKAVNQLKREPPHIPKRRAIKPDTCQGRQNWGKKSFLTQGARKGRRGGRKNVEKGSNDTNRPLGILGNEFRGVRKWNRISVLDNERRGGKKRGRH